MCTKMRVKKLIVLFWIFVSFKHAVGYNWSRYPAFVEWLGAKHRHSTVKKQTSLQALEQCANWASQGYTQICSACPVVACPTTGSNGAATSSGATSPSKISATSPPEALNVRLPKDLEPVLYTVELQPNMYNGEPRSFTFNGSVSIKIRCKTRTNKITLHIKKLNITSVISVVEQNGATQLYSSHGVDTKREFLIINTKTYLNPGWIYIVSMAIAGPLVPDLAGLYLSSYQRGNETIYITTSQMQVSEARKTFPCFDEPAIKAEFDVTLVRKSHMQSLSNMPILQSTPRGNGWIADRFYRTPIMSTYLLAMIVCDFNYITKKTPYGIEYRAWARPDAIDQTHYSLKVGVDILTYFEDFFNVPYPLQKQDMIAIPDFPAGAMENWGLITYKESAMLYQPGLSSEGNKQWVATVVSHELAHQEAVDERPTWTDCDEAGDYVVPNVWFGNLVTPSWWDDLWLNEGFASYVEYMGVDHVHPDWFMFEQFVVNDLQDVFNFDGLIASHPLYVPVNHPAEISEIFDRISYAKGASIIRMMRFFLGDSVFRNGLTRYLKKLEYRAAFHDDLWFALGNQSIAERGFITDVKGIMDTWVLQMNYPTVKVDYIDEGEITLSQSRYLRDYNATDPGKFVSPYGYKWDIPFTFTTNSQRRFNVKNTNIIMMKRKVGTTIVRDMVNIRDPEENSGKNWVIGNCLQYGYYRVNYDDRNWNALIRQLEEDHTVIPPINRAQVINDAWNLARSGDLDIRIPLRVTVYLPYETEYVPWATVSSELGFVSSMLQRDSLYGDWKKYLNSIQTAPFSRLGMNNTGATHLESFTRTKIVGLACSYGIQRCKDKAVGLFRQWMADENNNPIDPGIKYTVYCTAIAEGGIEEWEFVHRQYKTENLAAERARLRSTLACSKEPWMLSKYLKMAIDPKEIRRQDTVSVIVAISRNTIGRSLAWNFFRENWLFLKEFGGGFWATQRLVSGITSSFNTKLLYQQIQEFIAGKTDLGSGKRAFDQALEKTASNIQWMERNYGPIRDWLVGRNGRTVKNDILMI